MVEVSTSILTVEKGEESKTFFALEVAKTDYFHIDVMDGEFCRKKYISKNVRICITYRRISNAQLDVHLMVNDIKKAIDDFSAVEPNIITFHLEACKNEEEVFEIIKYISKIIVKWEYL